MNKEWQRSTVRDIPLYYNPKVSGLRMDTSTNPLGANPAAAKVLSECSKMDLNQYPSPYSDALREELAKLYGLKAGNFVVGNGSDEVLDIAFKSFMEPGATVLMPYPSYSLHGYFVKVNCGKVRTVDLKKDFQLDVESMLEEKAEMMILCTPNNPTSNTFARKDVEALLEGFGGPVIVDEAYAEFAGRSLISDIEKYPNLIVTRTFSKAYALAGMRIGYSAANSELAAVMQRVKIPYSLNRVSERVAIGALRDQEFVERSVRTVNEGRGQLEKGLEALGLKVYPSEANFILFKLPVESAKLVKILAEKGVMIRDFGKLRLLEDCVRTTIGTKEMNALLLEKLKEALRECR
ncbi:MAG TPA: histidinol-phosphate transaminase [Methanomassiliicoccales archaeon]|nr:histidinol-phosphate transaminase [Methanomassiliicoccales archaeon]